MKDFYKKHILPIINKFREKDKNEKIALLCGILCVILIIIIVIVAVNAGKKNENKENPTVKITATPAAEPTSGGSASVTPGGTENSGALTPTVTSTPKPTATNTPAPTATNTPVPTATNTPVPTATNTPVPTATKTPVPTATNTPVPTATNTPVPTVTSTPMPTATSTPVSTATSTPEPTATATPAVTQNVTPTPMGTATPTPTAAPTFGPRAEDTGNTLEEPNYTVTLEAADCSYKKFTVDGSERLFVTGLTDEGIVKVREYGTMAGKAVSNYVEIVFPERNENGKRIEGYVNYKNDGNNPLSSLLTEGSAYIKLTFPRVYDYFLGTSMLGAGDYAYKLRAIDFGEKSRIDYFCDNCFKGLLGLETLELPYQLESIGTEAFSGCTSLVFDGVDLAGISLGARTFEGVTFKNLALSRMFVIDEDAQVQEQGPFWGAYIESFDFNDTFNYIAPLAFSGAIFTSDEPLTTNYVVEIDTLAFAYSKGLKLWLTDNVWELHEDAFYGATDFEIHAKKNSASAYQLKKEGTAYIEF